MVMALPFTAEQRDAIRERLLSSARRHALDPGFKKTSLDMLTAEAGISKSSFYKFFDSKELLFLQISREWEEQILHATTDALQKAQNRYVFELFVRRGIDAPRAFCVERLFYAEYLTEFEVRPII